MAQFQVYRLTNGELVVDCQSNDLDILPTRFVVPLVAPEFVARPIKALHPIFEIDGRPCLMMTHAGAAISRSHLSEPIATLEDQRYTITNALDFLITGV